MKNKLWKMAMAMVLILPVLIMPPAVVDAAVKESFSDVSKKNPYYDMIHEMRDEKVISGYPDGTFKPKEKINRKQAAALVNRIVKLPVRKKFVAFKDVSTKNPYFNDIKKVQQAGIFEPDAKGNFYPNKKITRAEMAKVLTIAFDLKEVSQYDFLDVPRSHPMSEYIRAMYAADITTGDGGIFYPDIAVSRDHYAVFLYRTLHRNDPFDPENPEKPLPGQLTTALPEYLQLGEYKVAEAMLRMMGQKVTHYPADYLITDPIKDGPNGDMREVELYANQFGKYDEMAKQNILYLKKFAKEDSVVGTMLDRWLAGDFSQVVDDYRTLRRMTDDDYGNCASDVCQDDFLNARTKRAEEYFLKTIAGEEAVKRYHTEWGTE
ncbi:S-layer homology domain-containing protein [Sporosarcina sp. Sa2YVA2]|uniref:S-layer homology domain-containing protein n=1 Tax=Sporosarcina quadrami TaxID=2762234 RepID=A0ABR8UE30_9BACL|nr:S-layer homology domain-containing protein [Sporosarcina quadrami]MBD7986256.1 S-layer homology domain-containing protein [Sporosarcina quadrami]